VIAVRRALRESCEPTALVKISRQGGCFRSAGSTAALTVYPYCGSDLAAGACGCCA